MGLTTDWGEQGPPVLWRRPVGTGYSSPVVSASGALIIHQRVGDDEVVACHDAKTGSTRWEQRYPTTYTCRYEYSSGPYSTPAIDGDYVFTIGAQGQLLCWRLDDGAPVWKRELVQEFQVKEGLFAVGATPLIDGGRIIMNAGGSLPETGIVAFDKMNGETVWSATNDAAGYATPIAADIHGRRHLFVFTFDGLVSLEPESGKVDWSIPFRSKKQDSANATSPVVFEDLVLAVTGPGPGALCVRVLPGGGYKEVWRNERVLDSQFNTPILVGPYVYGYTSKWQRASLRCIDIRSGKLQWKWDSDLQRGSGIAVDGRLILWGEHGHLAALEIDPDKPVVRSMTKTPILRTPCYSSPALWRGLLYLRNEVEILCLDLRSSAPVDGVRAGF